MAKWQNIAGSKKFFIYRDVPSQADVAVFDALKKAPVKDTAPHAARWYARIASFEAADRKQFPKSQKDAASYVSGGKRKSKLE